MKRFFTILITLSLIFTLLLPSSSISFAKTSKATTQSKSKSTESSKKKTKKSKEKESSKSKKKTSSKKKDNKKKSEASSTETKSQEESTQGDSSETTSDPMVIMNENESTPEEPIGDDTAFYAMTKLGDDTPDISAESAILMDATTGAILYGKKEQKQRYPASITKTMTALLAIENCRMDEIVTFSQNAVNEEGSSAGINAGAELTMEDTLYALMLVSANQAATAIAEHIAGSNEAFADMMNERAAELGCQNTHFKNPHGLPDEEHLTTAYDMGLILRQAMKYDQFRKIAGTITYTIEKSDTLNTSIELWNHAKILRKNSEFYYKYAEGAKTGFTQAALNTLVTYAKKGDVELICVILKDYGADSSYNDTSALFKWGFSKVKVIKPLSEVKIKALISAAEDIDDRKKDSYMNTKTSYSKNYYILVPKKLNESKLAASFIEDVNKKAKRMGYLSITYKGKEIGRTPVNYEGSLTSADPSQPVDGSEDGLETAPNSDTSLRPRQVFSFLFKILIAIVLIVVVMYIIRLIIQNKNAKKDFGRRNRARARAREARRERDRARNENKPEE